MRPHSKLGIVTIILCFLFQALAVFAFAQAKADEIPPAPQTLTPDDTEEEMESEDPATAAVEMDLSGTSPVILALYQATRETKEKRVLDKLETVRQLIEQNSDLKAVDSSGRTALHWTVFGSSYATKPSLLTVYENIAELLMSRGVDINHEDKYNDTALDYLLYSPNFDMQILMQDRGATSGFFTATTRFLQETKTAPRARDCGPVLTATDLAPGLTFSLRLSTPVWSDHSRTGDPVAAVITAPVMRENEVLLAPGTKIEGTVLFAQKAPDKYSRPRLVLDFSNIVYADGRKSPMYTIVVAVDNARETVRNSEILGIIQPHASAKISMALSAVGMANPAASYAIRGMQSAYGLSLRREIHYPAGTDLLVQVSRPSKLIERQNWAGWPALPVKPELRRLVKGEPLRTESSTTPADLINVLFLGTEQQLYVAFDKAGWALADARSFSADLKAVQATLRQSGYKGAPVSLLTLNGKAPDLVFQKSLNTFAKRHHLRLWQQSSTYDGQSVWVGAATHDIGIGSTAAGTKWYHRIDPWIDRERDLIKTDLLFAGSAIGYALVDRPEAPRSTRNATGDDLNTDGRILVLTLRTAEAADKQATEVTSKETVRKHNDD